MQQAAALQGHEVLERLIAGHKQSSTYPAIIRSIGFIILVYV